nr:MAG TPA: Protein of unknown function (DUF3644) [Caudoviricetes sp.]
MTLVIFTQILLKLIMNYIGLKKYFHKLLMQISIMLSVIAWEYLLSLFQLIIR